MSLAGQRLQPERYALIPRTLTFLFHKDEILLIKVPKNRGVWSGLFNGVGGHIERGEEPHSAALREIFEETRLSPASLSLCGIVQIDTNTNPGIALFVFLGSVEQKSELPSGPEGTPEWIKISNLESTPLVEDLPQHNTKSIVAGKSGIPFIAKYHYEPKGQLNIVFSQG